MSTGTLDTGVAGGTDWVQVLTGTLPGSGASWATGGTGADGARLPEFNGGLCTQPHAGVSHCSRFPVSVIGARSCMQRPHPDEVTVARRPASGYGLGVRLRLRVREAPRSQVSELLIPPCLIRCH